MKKLIAGIISLAAALITVCAISVCAGALTSGDFEYDVLYTGDIEITGYIGSKTNVVIPSTINGSPVTSIGDRAFYENKKIVSVTIPDTVEKLGTWLFGYCSNLTKVTIPESVTEISFAAFYDCTKLKSVNIHEHIKRIGDSAFKGCESITSMLLPESVKNLGTDTFSKCTNLAYIAMTKDCSAASSTFAECPNLTDIYYAGTRDDWNSGGFRRYCAPDHTLVHYNYVIDPYLNLSTLKVKSRTSNSLTLSWNRIYEADGYLVEKFTDGTWQTVTTIKNNSTLQYTISGLEAGTMYSLRVKAYRNEGDLGYYSEERVINTCPSPTNVTGIYVKARSADALRLAWNRNRSADGYIIEMKSGSSWVRVGKITKNLTNEFKKSKLKAGTAYTFRIKAYKMAGSTAVYSGYTTISARTNPVSVSGLKLKGRASNALRISWSKNTSADGYIIEMKSGNKWVRVGKITKNSTVEFKKSGLKAGTAYTFRVKAYKMSGSTALYGAAKSISARTNPSAVSGLKLKAAASNAVRLSWTKNTSADGYIIEMKVGNTWKRVSKISKNTTVEVKKSGLKSKTSYSFRIKTYKMSGKTALYGAAKTITVKTK